jgi:hypothetical protein
LSPESRLVVLFLRWRGLCLPVVAPLHIHEREDETLYILEGRCTVQIGEQEMVASSGDSIFLPRGMVHAFRNDGPETLRLILTFVPAGVEQFFEEVLEPVTERNVVPPPPTKKLVERLLATGPKYGITFVLPE